MTAVAEVVVPEAGARPSASARLVHPLPSDRLLSWALSLLVTASALALRLRDLSFPHADVFDEVYYHWEALGLLHHGVEEEKAAVLHGIAATGADFVVQPPLGKWAIAAGIEVFGNNSFGYRIASVVAGTLCVLVLCRLARRIFRSTLLGCLAGLLLSLDGMEFVDSRTAVLDIFYLCFELLALACLVADRDWGRARLAARLDRADGAGWAGPRLGVRWWRLGAGFFLGATLAVKWDASYLIPAYAALAFAWDVGARRTAGVARPVRAALWRDWSWWLPSFVAVPMATYLASWTGWFLSNSTYAYDRHLDGRSGIIGSLANLWEYHRAGFKFATNLTTVAHCLGGKLNAAHTACVGAGTFYPATHHPYESDPFGWLVLARPVAFYYQAPKYGHSGCHALGGCSQEILLIGTPAIWWAGTLAVVVVLGVWLARRDWRAGMIALLFGATWLPWFASITRVMFDYYILPGLPMLILALVLLAGLVMRHWPRAGPLLVAGYTLLVVTNFAYLYPLLTGETVSYASWQAHMWLPGWI